jgi:hypothetical protein
MYSLPSHGAFFQASIMLIYAISISAIFKILPFIIHSQTGELLANKGGFIAKPIILMQSQTKPSPSKQQLYRQEFIDQPINYLKIIENPDKIKIDQLTRDIDPKDIKTLDRKKLIYPNPEPYIPPAPTPVQENHKFDSPIKNTPPKPPRPVNNISKYKFDLPQDSDEEEDFEIPQPKENTIEVLTPPKPPESHYTPPPQHTTQQYTPPQNYKLTTTPQYTPIQTPQLTPRQTPQLTPQHTPQFTPQRNVTTPQQSIHARLHNFLTNHDSGDDSDNESNTSYTYRNKKVKNTL